MKKFLCKRFCLCRASNCRL